jgi:DNA-binding MarR family transcriptional regulator
LTAIPGAGIWLADHRDAERAPSWLLERSVRLRLMEDDVAPDLARLLNRLMLPANRGALCAPVIAVAPGGVDGQTYPVLNMLASVGPVTTVRLAEYIGIDRSGASRYADRLEAAGLIKRTTDPLDRRASLLSLTPKGTRVIDRLNATLTAHLRSLTAAWPDGSARALAEGLELLLDGPAAPTARLGTAPIPLRRGRQRREVSSGAQDTTASSR